MALIDKPGIIYLLRFPNDKLYIGATTKRIEERFNDHINASKNSNTKFHKELQKYGSSSVEGEILDHFNNLKEADFLEKEYIQEYDTFSNGLNTSRGGQGVSGYIFNADDKETISRSQKRRFEKEEERIKTSQATKRWRQENPDRVFEMNEKRRKVVQSEEHRSKMSNVMKEVYQKNPEIIKKSTQSLKERYISDPDLRLRISRSLGGNSIGVYKDGVEVNVYPTLTSCSKELKISMGNIYSVLKGKRNHAGGFTFKKIVD